MFSSTPGAGAAAGVGSAGGAGGANVREVTYRVKVVADTAQANAAFAHMARNAQTADQAAQAFQSTGHYQQRSAHTQGMTYQPGHGFVPTWSGGGGGPGGGAGGAGGGRGMAADTQFLQGFQSVVARLGTAVAFVTMSLDAMQKVVHAINLSGRETINARAKMEAYFDAIPVVGPTVGRAMSAGVGLWERWGINGGDGYGAKASAAGDTHRLQEHLFKQVKLDKGHEFNRFLNDAVLGPAAATLGEFGAAEVHATRAEDDIARSPFVIARMQADAQARRRREELGLASSDAVGSALAARSAAKGQAGLLFADGPGRTRFDADDSYDAMIRSAERGRAAAESAAGVAASDANRAALATRNAAGEVDGKDFDRAQSEVERLAKKAKTDPTIQGTLSRAITKAEEEGAKYAEQLARHQEALNKEKEKSVSLAQAEYELAQKSLAVEQAKLSVVEQKLKRDDGYAESYAGMYGSTRQGLTDAAKQLGEGGFDTLSPRQRELLGGNSMTAEFFRKKSREFVNNDPEQRGGLDELLRLTGQQTRTELQQEQTKLQAQVELEFSANPEKLTQALRAAFKAIDPELKKLITESLKLNTAKADRQEAAANAQRKN